MSPPLLRLPLELRHQIYALLSRDSPLSYPFSWPSPVTSVDQLGPPLNLLLICRVLLEEVHAYYYGKATFRFHSDGAGPRAVSLRHKIPPAAMAAIRRMRRVEFVFLLTRPPWITKPDQMRTWLAEQVSLLQDEAPHLHSVSLSLRGAAKEHVGDFEKGLLAPLEELRGRVQFELGEIIAYECEDELCEELRGVLEGLNMGL